MVAMGEAAPSDWAEELERTGQVQFPLRSSRGWLPMAFVTVIGVQGYFGSAREMLSDEGWFIFGVIYWIGLLATAVWGAWRLTTRQPVLTVDRTGIRYGDRKPGLIWSEVSSIGPATGLRGLQILRILPKDIWAKTFEVKQDNVKDLDALAGWLTDLQSSVSPSIS